MSEQSSLSARALRFREAINDFITARRDDKLKGDGTPEQMAKYEYTTWLADAARRVSQIQSVTHVLKGTHPDARGTSLYCKPEELKQLDEIGTHSLGQNLSADVQGNAAALDVYKLLKIEVDGASLLDRLFSKDADLHRALSPDDKEANQWAEAFRNLIRSTDSFSSHSRAKQLYWCTSDEPTDDSGYHMLQPMFPSSLLHQVHLDIQTARFGERNKDARQAFRIKAAHANEYRDYRGLVARKLGGTKPQNISQLNSERGGVNYLLASLPPAWTQEKPRNFFYVETALKRFYQFEGVYPLIKQLLDLLANKPEATMKTRQKRDRIEQALGESLVAFALHAQYQFTPGWTREPGCRLPLCEQLWLDPGRAELPLRSGHEEEDQAFKDALTWGDWQDQVAGRFANWLNSVLRNHGLPVGDIEHQHWARQTLIEADWPVPMQRRAPKQEASHE